MGQEDEQVYGVLPGDPKGLGSVLYMARAIWDCVSFCVSWRCFRVLLFWISQY